MADELNFFDDSPGEMRAQFDMSIATLRRIDALLIKCHMAAMTDNCDVWHYSLLCIYRELAPYYIPNKRDKQGNLEFDDEEDKSIYYDFISKKNVCAQKRQNAMRASNSLNRNTSLPRSQTFEVNVISPDFYTALSEFEISLMNGLYKKGMLIKEIDSRFNIME